MEKAYVQYVSGWMFHSFGLHPTIGRLLTENDDLTPGAHPYAVLSYAYWKSRFNRDPKVVGRTLRIGNTSIRDRRCRPRKLHRHRTGHDTDIFLPTMMNPGENRPTWTGSGRWYGCNPASLLSRCARKWMRSAEHSKRRGRRVSSGCLNGYSKSFLSQKMLMDHAPAASRICRTIIASRSAASACWWHCYC